ncbi:MAG: hypothetical protein KAX19_08775 [Candidatus Brocadiae bacterium]|nr:hypothetical protein [Candidatus Brocadiia bacterium]
MKWSEFERLFGQLAMLFATMDFAASLILHFLISDAHMVIGATLTERMSLSRKLELIKKLSAYRLMQHREIEAEIRDWASKTKKFSKKRNLFIHGQWLFDKESEERLAIAGEVSVFDLRIEARVDGGKRDWTHGREHVLEVDELVSLHATLAPHIVAGLKLHNRLAMSPRCPPSPCHEPNRTAQAMSRRTADNMSTFCPPGLSAPRRPSWRTRRRAAPGPRRGRGGAASQRAVAAHNGADGLGHLVLRDVPQDALHLRGTVVSVLNGDETVTDIHGPYLGDHGSCRPTMRFGRGGEVGIFYAAGKGFREGCARKTPILPCDVMPTLLHIAGEAPLKQQEGAVLHDLLRPEG